MVRIWVLLFFPISTLANAQVEEKNGFFQYHEVFAQGDDFGEKYPAEITNSTIRITRDMNHRNRITENPMIYGTGFGSELIRLLTRQLVGKMTLLNQAGTKVSFEFLM